jgi:DNA-binding winged helix-turn-helix (wHTH) protein
MDLHQSPSEQMEIAQSPLAIPSLPARYARFGSFQIDSERQELSRGGERVRIQAKVYQTLLILVGQAGNIVTREDVGRCLWPDRSSSTLDANVNTAMNKLRQALGDSTDNPVYVETIPRRGYCFMAPLEFSDVAAPAAAVAVELSGTPRLAAAENAHFGAIGRQVQFTMPIALRVATLLLAGMLVGALLTIAWYSFYNKNHKTLNSTQERTTRPFLERPAFHL